MIARKINESEVRRTEEVFGIAFEFKIDQPKKNDELLKKMNEKPRNRGDKYCLEKWASFDDDNNMMAWIGATPYNVNFDGNVVKMTGIGGVSSLPQYRRNGAVRACFNECLNSMYENDYTLSYLYPFSTAYYKQFGYELCGEVINYMINLKSIKRFPEADGTVYLVEKGSHYEDIKKVYNDFADGYNLMCVREDIDYNAVLESDPAVDMHYIYVYKDKNGIAKGVMSFEKAHDGGKFNMQTKMFYFSDLEGLKGLFNHMLAFSAYYEHVVIMLPMDINLTSFVPEWSLYSYKRENNFHGMVRVVNVKKALMLAKYNGSGSLVISIADKQLAPNNDTFEIIFDNDKAVSCEISDKPCDVSMDISDFSRLLIGTHSPCDLKYIEQVKINCELAKVAKVFYKKLHFIADHF